MIRMTFIISLIFLRCSYKSETIPKDKEYTDVILIYRDPILGGCGNLALAYRFKFRNVDNDSSLTGIIRCPDTYGDGFFRRCGCSFAAVGVPNFVRKPTPKPVSAAALSPTSSINTTASDIIIPLLILIN